MSGRKASGFAGGKRTWRVTKEDRKIRVPDYWLEERGGRGGNSLRFGRGGPKGTNVRIGEKLVGKWGGPGGSALKNGGGEANGTRTTSDSYRTKHVVKKVLGKKGRRVSVGLQKIGKAKY